MALPAERLRMRDVCARTGLARSTIHHYIREGLLPRPNKTGRNTAWYDDEFVRRAQLVKTLQQRTHLPLATIRQTLDSMPEDAVDTIDVERVARVTQTIADNLRLSAEHPTPRAEVLAATGLRPFELDGLETVGLIEASGRGNERTYGALDFRIAMAFSRLRDAGLAADGEGYLEVVRAYRKHLTALARVEAREMVRRMRALAEADLDELVQRSAGPVGDLVAALHQKALVRAITDVSKNG